MDKRKNNAAGVVIGILIAALLCVGAFFLARNIVSSKSASLGNAIPTSASAGQAMRPLGNGMIYYDGATLHALNDRAQQVWSYAVGSSAGFSVGTGGVAAWSDTMLSLLTADKGLTLFSGNVEAPVLDARIGRTFTAVQVGQEHDSVMLVLDSGGRQVDRIPLNHLTLLDFGFFNNGALMWVMSLNTEGTVPMCSISTYRPGKMLAGTITDTQQVLYEVVFQSSKVRAVGTTHIKDYEYTNKEITGDRMLVYGWYLMGMDEEDANPLMIFVPTAQSDGATGISDLRLIRGQSDQAVRLPYPAMRVLAKGDTAYAFTGQYVMICRMGESLPRTYTLPIYVENVLGITDSKKAIVTSSGLTYLLPLP